MAVKDIKLNQAALKLLAEYSEAEGVTPSEAVLRFVPKPKKKNKKTTDEAFEALLSRKPSNLSDASISKMAVDAVRQHRANKQ